MQGPEIGHHEVVDVAIEGARAALTAVFEDVGATQAEAGRMADALVDAELCEVPTHGLLRVPWYLHALRGATVACGIEPTVTHPVSAVTVVDGHGAYGYLPTWLAVEEAVTAAGTSGVAAAFVRHVAEFGRAAYYTAAAARRGCVAIVCQNTMPLLAAPGSETATHGNNPLAFAAPGADAPSFDAAFTARSGGELRRRAVLGLPLPLEWGYVDAAGAPTTSPEAAAATAQQAVGGAKGFGMAVLVDLLAGVLSGSASGVAVPPGAAVVGAAVIVIDPQVVGVPLADVEQQLATTAGVVRATGGRWPGDRAAAARSRALVRGSFAVPRPIFDAAAEAMGGPLRP